MEALGLHSSGCEVWSTLKIPVVDYHTVFGQTCAFIGITKNVGPLGPRFLKSAKFKKHKSKEYKMRKMALQKCMLMPWFRF